MTDARSSLLVFGGTLLRALVLGPSFLGCASVDTHTVTTLDPADLPSESDFKANVDLYLERRCGSLDCHGQIGRPLRIYGKDGLRYNDPDPDASVRVSGFAGTGTTDAEMHQNYLAVIGLEPEAIRRVFVEARSPDGTKADDPESGLLIVTKPLNKVRHRGGAVVKAGQDGDLCMRGWVTGATDAPSCAAAGKIEP